MRVSFATGWPSAVIAIQEVWSARISRVNVSGDWAAAGELGFVAGGLTLGAGVFAVELPVDGDGLGRRGAAVEAAASDGRAGATDARAATGAGDE